MISEVLLFLYEMSHINKKAWPVSNKSFKPSFRISPDLLINDRSFKRIDYNVAIMYYMGQSLDLVDSCSNDKRRKTKEENICRSIPLHKRTHVIDTSCDTLNVEPKDEITETSSKNTDDVLDTDQLNALENHLDEEVEKEEVDSVEQVQIEVKPDPEPIVIPAATLLSSDEESDSEPVSIVAFDLKSTKFRNPKEEEVEANVKSRERCLKTPKPILKRPSGEFSISTEKPKESGRITPSSPPILNWKLGARLPYTFDELLGATRTPSIVNFDSTNLFCEGKIKSCEHFNRGIKSKEKYLNGEIENRSVMACSCKNRIHVVNGSINTTKATPLVQRPEKKAARYNWGKKTDGSPFANVDFNENTNSRDILKERSDDNAKIKPHKINNGDCHHTARFFNRYVSAKEVDVKKIVPKKRDVILNCTIARKERMSIKQAGVSTENDKKTPATVGLTQRKKKIISPSSQQLQTNSVKKCGPVVPPAPKPSLKASTLPARESVANNSVKKTNCTKDDDRTVPVEIETISVPKRLIPRRKRKKHSLSMKNPPVTMVSRLTISSLENESKSDQRKKNSDISGVSATNKPNSRKTSCNKAKVDVAKTSAPDTKTSTPDTKTLTPATKILTPAKTTPRPDEDKNDRAQSVPHKATRSYSATGVRRRRWSSSSAKDEFNNNEYRDIQNILKDENINVSMDMIKNILLKPDKNPKPEEMRSESEMKPD